MILLSLQWPPGLPPACSWKSETDCPAFDWIYVQMVCRSFRVLSVITSDVKFHEIFCLEIFREIFHEIFHEIFQKFHDVFFRLYTHPFNIFLYVKHYLSFIYAYCSSLSLSAGLLAWFACLSTGSNSALSIDYYDVRHTVQPSGGHRSEGRQCLKYGHPYSALALASQCLGCCWKDGCCWTSEQRTTSIKIHPIQTKTNKSADIPFL